jgi:hypothetical protein
MALIDVPTDEIDDWQSFHDVMARALRFPAYYGRNGNAFIDCLRDIADGRDAPQTLASGETLTINLGDSRAFRARCPEQFEALAEWTAMVNGDSVEDGGSRRIALAITD